MLLKIYHKFLTKFYRRTGWGWHEHKYVAKKTHLIDAMRCVPKSLERALVFP